MLGRLYVKSEDMVTVELSSHAASAARVETR
jgi:hypothetical protein